jgi:hypothetical protein
LAYVCVCVYKLIITKVIIMTLISAKNESAK